VLPKLLPGSRCPLSLVEETGRRPAYLLTKKSQRVAEETFTVTDSPSFTATTQYVGSLSVTFHGDAHHASVGSGATGSNPQA
jgi:hypothetical protein